MKLLNRECRDILLVHMCWLRSFVAEGIFFAQGDYFVAVGMNSLVLNHKYLGKPWVYNPLWIPE